MVAATLRGTANLVDSQFGIPSQEDKAKPCINTTKTRCEKAADIEGEMGRAHV
jgi:hypothetical protein